MTETKAEYKAENWKQVGVSPTETPTSEQTEPFLPSSPAVEYIISRWVPFGGSENGTFLIVEGTIKTLSAKWEIKDGPYNSQSLTTYGQLEFGVNGNEPFKCDIVVSDPLGEITAAGDDLAIVRIVMQRFARQLDLATTDILVQHMKEIGLKPVEPVRGRVEGGTARKGREETL